MGWLAWLTSNTAVQVITGVVTICSALANVIPAKTIAGKVLHFLALNLKSVFPSDQSGTTNP